VNGTDAANVRFNAWQFRQILGRGVHPESCCAKRRRPAPSARLSNRAAIRIIWAGSTRTCPRRSSECTAPVVKRPPAGAPTKKDDAGVRSPRSYQAAAPPSSERHASPTGCAQFSLGAARTTKKPPRNGHPGPASLSLRQQSRFGIMEQGSQERSIMSRLASSRTFRRRAGGGCTTDRACEVDGPSAVSEWADHSRA
jgi:hypothetical protein